VLDRKKTKVKEERASKKQPLRDAEAKELLRSVDEVVLSRGKAQRRLAAKEASLDDLRGPTGSFRAPMLKVGRRLLVGFSADALDETLG
jgi:hypothetical protein